MTEIKNLSLINEAILIWDHEVELVPSGNSPRATDRFKVRHVYTDPTNKDNSIIEIGEKYYTR